MNLFLIGYTAKDVASNHCDKHVIKMILEIAQLLYTAWWCSRPKVMQNVVHPKPYRATHKNHPTAIWVRAHPNHYHFAAMVGLELCREYTRRYGKVHKTQQHIERLAQMGAAPSVEETYTPPVHKCATTGLPEGVHFFHCAVADELFPQCARYTDGQLNAVETYRAYYKTKGWKMKWNRGKEQSPTWYEI